MTLNFLQAVLLMMHGHKMRRRGWLRGEFYIHIVSGQFRYWTGCPETIGVYTLAPDDVLGCDWEEYKY